MELLTPEEIEEILSQMDTLIARYNEEKRELLELLHRLKPERCGRIDFTTFEVWYDEEKYTEWYSNYRIEAIEDWLRIFDMVGLDYELRVPDYHISPSSTFSMKYANTEEDKRKYRVAEELRRLYWRYYGDLLMENGINVLELDNPKYVLPWSGCEKEIAPDRYNDTNLLLTEEQILRVLGVLYPCACEKVSTSMICQYLKDKKRMLYSSECGVSKGGLVEKSLVEWSESRCIFNDFKQILDMNKG